MVGYDEQGIRPLKFTLVVNCRSTICDKYVLFDIRKKSHQTQLVKAMPKKQLEENRQKVRI